MSSGFFSPRQVDVGAERRRRRRIWMKELIHPGYKGAALTATPVLKWWTTATYWTTLEIPQTVKSTLYSFFCLFEICKIHPDNMDIVSSSAGEVWSLHLVFQGRRCRRRERRREIKKNKTKGCWHECCRVIWRQDQLTCVFNETSMSVRTSKPQSTEMRWDMHQGPYLILYLYSVWVSL